jgi:hypothetical protein
MKDFDWIIEHEVVPDLDNNLSFDGITVIVPRSLLLVEYDGVLHLEGFPKVAKQVRLRKFLQDNFYEGKRVHIPFLPRMELKVVENRNYIPDNLWEKLSQEQRDKLTTVRFYWRGVSKLKRNTVLFCFELTMKNVKELYKNNMIRLNYWKNPVL